MRWSTQALPNLGRETLRRSPVPSVACCLRQPERRSVQLRRSRPTITLPMALCEYVYAVYGGVEGRTVDTVSTLVIVGATNNNGVIPTCEEADVMTELNAL